LLNLKSTLQLEGIIADIDLIKVHDDVEATRFKFLGSPSVRVDGRDLWPEERGIYSLSCRVYPAPEGSKGFPTVAMLRQRLKQSKGA
jgi:hypothetical protein